jgi:hypothetical protein
LSRRCASREVVRRLGEECAAVSVGSTGAVQGDLGHSGGAIIRCGLVGIQPW